MIDTNIQPLYNGPDGLAPYLGKRDESLGSLKVPLRVTFGLLAVQICLVLTLGACGAASSDTGTQAKLRICVADFRPDKNTTLTERELDYCKMLQRAVEDELVQWYEVEESTRYGSVAKQLANLDSAQAARVLGEKAGVHQVVTGLVTKVGSSVVVQCHFVEVPRAEEQSSDKSTNRVLRTVTVSYKVSVDDDWVVDTDILGNPRLSPKEYRGIKALDAGACEYLPKTPPSGTVMVIR